MGSISWRLRNPAISGLRSGLRNGVRLWEVYMIAANRQINDSVSRVGWRVEFSVQ